MYPTYLIHYNKNHSKKNGQFVSGDGDGDGRGDEHHRYTKTGYNTSNNGGLTSTEKSALKKAGIATGVVAGTVATIGAGKYGLKKLNEHRDAKWRAKLLEEAKKKKTYAGMRSLMTKQNNISHIVKKK